MFEIPNHDEDALKKCLPRILVDPLTRTMRDENGNQIIFHGVNVVYKDKPYLPDMENFSP